MTILKVKGLEDSKTCFSFPQSDLKPNSEYKNLGGGQGEHTVCAIGWIPKFLIKVFQKTAPSINVYRLINLEITFWAVGMFCTIIFYYFLYL